MNMLASMRQEYSRCLELVRRLEPAFLELRSALTAEQQDLLDAYITACEALSEVEQALACESKEQSAGDSCTIGCSGKHMTQ